MKTFAVATACLLLVGSAIAQSPMGMPSMSVPTTTASPPSVSTPSSSVSRSPASGPSIPNAAGLTPGSGSTPTDADILYFAYNLEILEADFYNCIVSGTPVSSQYTGGGPAPTGCIKGNLSANVLAYATELAKEESAHVALLYTALKAAGANPVAPQVDISNMTFNAAAQLATGANSLNPQFAPAANDLFFIHSAFIFEDVGTSAYLGALNSISNSSYRLVAAQIGATEAYHASLINTLLYQILNTVPAYNLTVANITNGITSLENTLAGTPQIRYNIYTNSGGAQISNVDSNALVPAASAQQVLRVVTFGAAAGSGGGFFPNNLNGNVKN